MSKHINHEGGGEWRRNYSDRPQEVLKALGDVNARGCAEYPLRHLKASDIDVVLVDAFNVGNSVGDNVMPLMVVDALVKKFPGKRVFVLSNRFELFAGKRNVTPLNPDDEKIWDLLERQGKKRILGVAFTDPKISLIVDSFPNFEGKQFLQLNPGLDTPGVYFDCRHKDGIPVLRHTGVNTQQSIYVDYQASLEEAGFQGIQMPKINLTSSETAAAEKKLRSFGARPRSKSRIRILVNPFASTRKEVKEANVSVHAKLISMLQSSEEYDVLLSSGPDESSAADAAVIEQRVLRETRKRPVVVPPARADRLSLREFTAVLSQVDYIITPDCGVTHLANALQKHCLTFYGDRIDALLWNPGGELAGKIVSDDIKTITAKNLYESIMALRQKTQK